MSVGWKRKEEREPTVLYYALEEYNDALRRDPETGELCPGEVKMSIARLVFLTRIREQRVMNHFAHHLPITKREAEKYAEALGMPLDRFIVTEPEPEKKKGGIKASVEPGGAE